MHDLTRHWKKARQIEAAITAKDVFIVSVEDETRGIRGGRIHEVSAFVAGQRIAEGRAELATPDQIEAHKKEQDATRVRNAQEEFEQRQRRLGVVFQQAPTQTDTKRK